MSGLSMKYFVLSPIKTDPFGMASRKAILNFADEIEKTNQVLAKDLRNWIIELEANDEPPLEDLVVDDDLRWWFKLTAVEQLEMIDKYFEGTNVLDITHRNVSYMYLEEIHR